MKPAKFTLLLAPLLFLAACIAGLSPELRRDIADEHDRLQNAAQEIQRAEQTVNREVSADPALFSNTPAPGRWTAEFQNASDTLRTAEETDRDLNELAGRNRAELRSEAERLLTKERTLRRAATKQAQTAIAGAACWVDFRRDLPAHLAQLQQQYQSVHTADFAPLAKTVEQAEHDWPAKQDFLETRLNNLRAIPKSAQTLWDNTADARQAAAANTIADPQLATLIEASDTLSADAHDIDTESDNLRALSGQLYDSWDKILVDLDKDRDQGDLLYRERIKTVRSHLTDVAAKQAETSSSEQWLPVSEPAFQSVENDIGMSLAHKDAGLFDSEAITTPQPAGFAYMATEAQGSNQYGYWAHDGGNSVWTWLPQYLVLRELLWNHSYHPVLFDEYRGYRSAQQIGRTYYGRPTPASPPKYGTHGSFTQSTYASSRYVQSGGFRSSAYGSHGGFSEAHNEPRRSPSVSEKSGHRFGFGASPQSGRRFGGSRGFGHGFGRHR